ncbi:cytochrome c oxidase assembly protein [Novosphingobium sp. M1R2S20]|uniref:Cytochrome c oxidase assembly protein n=1 Tax=Novosphingobium rhizovicinum TaxID=3228928 RepID=A0ABV3RAL8_9SPHN
MAARVIRETASERELAKVVKDVREQSGKLEFGRMEGIALNVPYCGPAPLGAEWIAHWNFDPLLIGVLLLLAMVSARFARADRRAAAGAGIFVLFVAFVSPLCALSSALFSARIVHHVLLVAVAAPLLAWALPARSERGMAFPFAVSSLVLWLWHAPQLYTAALNDLALYWVMQVSLLATAVWFWRSVFAVSAVLPAALLTVSAAVGQMGLLGALLTFAPRALYPHHWTAPLSFGLTPLQDQQLAGLIMWVPAMLPYLLIAALMARNAWSRNLAQAVS